MTATSAGTVPSSRPQTDAFAKTDGGRGLLSAAIMARSGDLFPGGVNSPVRAFGGVGGQPFVAACGEGARIRDVDGREYIDYVLSWAHWCWAMPHRSYSMR